MTTPTYTKSGTKTTAAAKLDKSVFGMKVESHALLKDAYLAYLANGRQNLAVTKKRGEVRGGGRKPWRQKGTGRARIGSTRAPQWRHGGIVFGPTGMENYTKRLTVNTKHVALRQALSLAAEDKVIVIESVVPKDAKTAALLTLLEKIGATKKVLLVVDKKTDELQRASRNIPGLKLISATFLTVYDILNADHLVFTEAALTLATQWLATDVKENAK